MILRFPIDTPTLSPINCSCRKIVQIEWMTETGSDSKANVPGYTHTADNHLGRHARVCDQPRAQIAHPHRGFHLLGLPQRTTNHHQHLPADRLLLH